MADDPDLTGRVRLDLTRLISGLRYAQAVTRRQIGILVRQANARLRDLDTDPLRRGLVRVAGMVGSLGRLAAPFAAVGVAIGGVLPLLAGLLTSLANMVPAAALAVTGLLAIGLASSTLKLAMSGVGDAVKAALDPSDPKAYAEALKQLSPNARAFVQEIHKARPALDAIKKSVQDRVFAGLDKQLASTAKTALPDLRRSLDSTATTLNKMGKGVLTAVRGLGKDGALGVALKGATSGLREFSRAPGQVVTALGQIAAAAAPAFARLSKAGGSALDRLSKKIAKSFESGRMEAAIERAIDLVGQLGRVFGNVFSGIGNILNAASTGGDGLFGTLERVTGAFKDLTATKAFKDGLRALVETSAVVSRTALPLLSQALQTVGRVFVTLSKPVQTVVKILGGALGRVLEALDPVLIALAGAFGSLLVALGPVIDLIADVIVAVLPAATVLFEQLGAVIEALSPVIAALAGDLSAALVPLLSSLGPILEIILPPFVRMAQEIFPLLSDMLVQLTPSFEQVGVALANLAIAVAPLLVGFTEIATVIMVELAEKAIPLAIDLITALADIFTFLVGVITTVVVPQLQMIIDVLNGDFDAAWLDAMDMVNGAKRAIVQALEGLSQRSIEELNHFAAGVIQQANRAADGFIKQIQNLVVDAVVYFATLPQRIVGALGNLGGLLFSAGASVISGFIAGIESKVGSVRSTLSGLTSMIPNWKGPKRKDATLLTPAGKSIIKGLVAGIDASTSSLKSKLTSVTNLIERAIGINSKNRHKTSGLSSLLSRVEKDNKKLLSLAKQRDTAAAKLKAAQDKLADAIKERSQAATQIREGIVGDANITTGNAVVNSVSAITIGLQQAALKARLFAANLAKLKSAGLRTDLLDDIAAAGLDGGAATAAALAKATPAELKKINSLQASLVSSAGASGSTVAGAMYDAGVKAAQGLVNGLKKNQASIEKAMEKIGEAMVKAIKKKLKIHSPSRVATQIGTQFMEGLPIGFEGMRAAVSRSAASVVGAAASAASAVQAVGPTLVGPGQLSAAAYAGVPAAGPTTNNFYLQGSDATPDGIISALSWRGLVGRKGRF
ncbi:phage tail protein [Streptomyces drozdowiczii]|uniref:phage tail protein n=1 Tax=Streptomyces drozdowiczii TaxID=202862 RepID=UPI00403D1357